MYSIARIEQLIRSAREVLAEQEAALLEKSGSAYRQMLVESSRAQVDEFTRQLVDEKAKRDLEVIEIRLIGEKAQHGPLPLHILSELTDSFEEILVQAGRFLLYGSQGQHPIQEIRNLMDVRLKRVASGSTRLFVTAKTNPDLFGHSLAEDSLAHTFGLLNAETATDLSEQVASLGSKSVRGVTRFLRALTESQLQAHVDWQTPVDATINWTGTLDRIGLLQHSLANISQEEPKEVSFDGEVLMESIRGYGKFEIRDCKTGKVYKGFAPKPVLPSLLALHVGEGCKGTLLETVVENQASTEQKRVYELTPIEPTQLPKKESLGQQIQLPF